MSHPSSNVSLIPTKGTKKIQKHQLFITVQLTVPAATEKGQSDPMFNLCSCVKDFLRWVWHFVHKFVLLNKYHKKHDDEWDALTKPSKLPDKIMGLKEYGNNLIATITGGALFANFQLSLNGDPKDFLENLIAEGWAWDMWIKKNPLQLVDTEIIGFVA